MTPESDFSEIAEPQVWGGEKHSAWGFLASIPSPVFVSIVVLAPALLLFLFENFSRPLTGTLAQWKRIFSYEVFSVLAYAYVHHNVTFLTMGCISAIEGASQKAAFCEQRVKVLAASREKVLCASLFAASTLLFIPTLGTGCVPSDEVAFYVLQAISTFFCGFCVAFLLQVGLLIVELSKYEVRVGVIPHESIALKNASTVSSQVALAFMLGLGLALGIYVTMAWSRVDLATQLATWYGLILLGPALFVLAWPQLLLLDKARYLRDKLIDATEVSFNAFGQSLEGISASKDRTDHVEKLSSYLTRLRGARLLDFYSVIRYTLATLVVIASIAEKLGTPSGVKGMIDLLKRLLA